MDDLLIELYYELLQAGPTTGDVEFWDPTVDALELLEELLQLYSSSPIGGE